MTSENHARPISRRQPPVGDAPLHNRRDSRGRRAFASWVFALSLALFLTVFTGALGQEETASPTPEPEATPAQAPTPEKTEEQKRLEEENATLTLQKTNAELKKAIRDARPTATATPLEGKATLDENVAIEAEIISYKTMGALMDKIAQDIQTSFGSASRFFIYSPQDINDWRYYRVLFPTFKKKVEDISSDYSGVIAAPQSGPGALVEAFETGSTIIRSLVDLVAMFRTDTDLQGKSVTIDDVALTAEAMRALSAAYSKKVTVYNPSAFGPQLLAVAADSNRPLTAAGATPPEPRTLGEMAPPFGAQQPGQLPYFRSEVARLLGELSIRKKEADKTLALLAPLKADMEEQKRLADDTAAKTEAIAEDRRLIARYAAKLNNKKVRSKLKPAEIEALEDLKAQKEAEVKRFEAVIDSNNTKARAVLHRIETARAMVKPKLPSGVRDADLEDLVFIARRIDEIKAVNGTYNTFVDSAVKVDAQGTASPLTLFVKGETMEALANDDNAYWVVFKAVKAGGNNRVQRNLIRYFTGPKITYNGAAIVSYTLYDRGGRVVGSDTRGSYSHFMSSSKIKGFEPVADDK